MKILIKSSLETYMVLNKKDYLWHSCCYYPFLFYECFRSLGHDVKFYGDISIEGLITNELTEYDLIFWCEIPSFGWKKEESLKVLSTFKGKNAFYIPTCYDLEEGKKYFDYIFVAECKEYKDYYIKEIPNAVVEIIPWISPSFEFIDRVQTNPYKDNGFKVIYTGIIKSRYLRILNYLAEMGENIYLGGTYFKKGETLVRAFTKEEIEGVVHPKIKLITSDATFTYGYHFNWLKYADVGINFYPAYEAGAVSSKITDYLVSGLPVISEYPAPNNFRLLDLNAGQITEWNSPQKLYDTIQKEKQIKRNRDNILKKARDLFNPLEVCKKIIKVVS